jgi:hypothetical protein
MSTTVIDNPVSTDLAATNSFSTSVKNEILWPIPEVRVRCLGGTVACSYQGSNMAASEAPIESSIAHRFSTSTAKQHMQPKTSLRPGTRSDSAE